MKLFEKCFVLLFVIMFVFVVSAPVVAATTYNDSEVPEWLIETGAMPVSDIELEQIQGEFAFATFAAIVMGTTATIMLAEFVYLEYKFITGKPFTYREKLWFEDFTGLKIP